MRIRKLINSLFLYGLVLPINGKVMADAEVAPPGTLAPTDTEATHTEKHTYGMDRPRGWILGAGFVVRPNPFVGDAETPVQPFPMLGYFGERLTWMGPMISYNLYRGQATPIALDVMTKLRFEGFDENHEDPQLAGLEERDSAFELGFKLQAYMLSLSAFTDVSDTHDGYELLLAANHKFPLTNKLGLDINAGAAWRSDRLNNYYYGVRTKEATLQRPEYQARSGLNYRIGLKFDYKFNKHWIAMTNLNYDWLPDEIQNSPIVEKDYQYSFMAAIIYRFDD